MPPLSPNSAPSPGAFRKSRQQLLRQNRRGAAPTLPWKKAAMGLTKKGSAMTMENVEMSMENVEKP